MRNTRFNIVDTKSVPLSWTVGQLIEEMGGRYGARIQELRHVAGGGFTPGLTFMFGTKKTVAETGWKGNIQLCLHQARN